MSPCLSQNSPCGVHVELDSNYVRWYDISGFDTLSIHDKEVLRLESKYFAHSLEFAEASQVREIYRYIEDKATRIRASGSSLPMESHFQSRLDALKSDVLFQNLLCGGFAEPCRAGKVWGGCKYKEMVTFIKWRFGPAYSLLIICIFGTTGWYGSNRLTISQLAKIVQWVGQDIDQKRNFYWSGWKKYWNMSIDGSNDKYSCLQPLYNGGKQLEPDIGASEDPQGSTNHLSAERWHTTVMNKGARYSHQLFSQVIFAESIIEDHEISDVGNLAWSATRAQFLVLMYSMGCNRICDDILRRGFLPQYRWDRNGHRAIASRTDITQFAEIFGHSDVLDQEIRGCSDDGLVDTLIVEDGTQYYTLSSNLESLCFANLQNFSDALFAFAAYVFPRDEALDQSHCVTGRLLIPMMDRLWELLQRGNVQDLPLVVKEGFIEASLSACRLVSLAKSKSILLAVRRLQGIQIPFVSPYLAAMLTWQMSVNLRAEGKHEASDTHLDEGFCQLPEISSTDPDIRLYCAYGRLSFSKAENALMRNDFVAAWHHVDRWDRWKTRTHPPSMMEIKLIRIFNTIFGRIARYTGNFSLARECFERCLNDGDPSYRHIQFHLADVYCELGCANQAKEMLLDVVQQLREKQLQSSRVFRRLALALAESYINLRNLDSARATLEEVLEAHERMKQHDMTDQLGHVRTLISLARVDWYEKLYLGADERIKRATALMENYSTFIPGGFDFAFINLFHSVVKRALASELLSKVPRGYFMAGNGSYFFDEISANAWAGNAG